MGIVMGTGNVGATLRCRKCDPSGTGAHSRMKSTGKKLESLRNRASAMVKKLDPADGEAYSLPELKKRYQGQYSKKETASSELRKPCSTLEYMSP